MSLPQRMEADVLGVRIRRRTRRDALDALCSLLAGPDAHSVYFVNAATANLAFDAPVALPSDGVYAVRAGWGGRNLLEPERWADGVASLGVRPTFKSDGPRLLEVHLFDVAENLYGKRLRVEFVRRLRGEKRFANATALVRQMDRDAARARAVLT